MKINTLLVNLLFIMKSTLAQENGLDNLIKANTKVDLSSGECRVVNRMLGKDDSYDCCNLLNIVECENRHITKIHIENKNITGEIPEEIGNLIYLRELWLDHNQLHGNIPLSIGNLIYLKDLSLGHNYMYGPIPVQISDCKALEKLNLYENELYGTIPRELGDLPNLWYLDLHNNSLHGEIPSQLGKLTKLKVLNLDYNELNIASIPHQIQNLPNLTEFHYLNQREHIDQLQSYYDSINRRRNKDNLTSFGILLFGIVVLAWCYFFCCWRGCCCSDIDNVKEKKDKKNFKVINNNESSDCEVQINSTTVTENNQIAVTVEPPKAAVAPQKAQLDVNTLQLKQQIEQQEKQLQEQIQQQQLQLQQIQQMKSQLQQYE